MVDALIWQPTLEGAHLRVRPLTQTDWAALHRVASDPEIWAGHPVQDRWKEPIFRAFFDNVMGKRGAMAVLDKTSGAMIGSSTFHNHRPERSEVEIGNTFLARAYWGGGFNGELKSLMLTHAFRYVERVVFRIGEANLRSRRACEKIGGQLTERTEILEGPHGPIVHLVYQINRKDFDAGRAPGSPFDVASVVAMRSHCNLPDALDMAWRPGAPLKNPGDSEP